MSQQAANMARKTKVQTRGASFVPEALVPPYMAAKNRDRGEGVLFISPESGNLVSAKYRQIEEQIEKRTEV